MCPPATTGNNGTTGLPIPQLIQFNPAAQLPIKLQGNLNFATWKAQLVMLLNGHKLIGHLTGAKPAPPSTITQNNTTIENPEFEMWFCQDQLIQQAMMASVDPTIAPTVATASSTKLAWELLHTALSFEELFHKLTDHELFLKHQDLEKSSSTITAAVAQRTNFQPQQYKNNRRFSNQSWKSSGQRQESTDNPQSGRQPRQAVKCQLCQKIGHTADVCRSKSHNHFEAKVNFVSNHHPDANPWILDSGATHHVTTDSDNLEEYTGNEKVSMGDGPQNSETTGTRPKQKWTL
ncbi:hypothetical protein KY285_025777 [Solanum tuberosum]|nr:hypothetical protein KY289_024189 [Solanum tuberosum]KAH0677976.1 hypothetical protein KY285_025777 [Solanum tuberosum]